VKVMHLISGGDSGGAKTHVHSLLSNLCRSIDVTLVCFMNGPFAEEAKELGIPTVVMEGSLPANIRRLRTMIRDGGYEIVHCHGARGNLMGFLLKPWISIPTVSTVHSDYKLDYMGRKLAGLTYGKLNVLSLRSLDYRIGVSGFMRDQLISRGFAPNDIFVIYNGVDFNRVAPEYSRRSFYERLGLDIDEEHVVVGIAARLDPVKDVATLIRGFARAWNEQPQLRLIVAGDGAEREQLEQLAAELGVGDKVFFIGWVSNMDEFYQSIDINTLTSISETFPYAITEGAFAGLPTVASRVGGIPALVKHMQTGLLFEAGDAESLARHLALLGSDAELRKQLGQALHEKAKNEFSAQATSEKQKEIYAEILRRYHLKRGERDGVLVCGAYGHSNAGDEAILSAIIHEMRQLDANMSITVLSRRPKETQVKHRVNAIYTFNIPKFLHVMRKTKLYLNGGGSLIQDVTSSRSLVYYLYTIAAAKKCGNRVIMYGCGIGPIQWEYDRNLVRRVLNQYVDTITLRESHSIEELQRLGVRKPEIMLSSDPTLALPKADDERINTELRRQGIDPDGRYICFALRTWAGFSEKAGCFAQAATHAYRQYGLIPLFLSINNRRDGEAAALVTARLDIPYHVISDPLDTELTIGIVSRMTAMVSMRLHGLIFAAAQAVPLVGISYDPKVSAFLKSVKNDKCTNLDEITGDLLCACIDNAVEIFGERERLTRRVAFLREVEQRNIRAAKRLLSE
jgi:polysaccharide pyruvyl transferase CsaB